MIRRLEIKCRMPFVSMAGSNAIRIDVHEPLELW